MELHVSLPTDLSDFVEAEISNGRFRSVGDVVHEALRLMQRLETFDGEDTAALRDAWHEGMRSEDEGELDFAALKREARAGLGVSKP